MSKNETQLTLKNLEDARAKAILKIQSKLDHLETVADKKQEELKNECAPIIRSLLGDVPENDLDIHRSVSTSVNNWLRQNGLAFSFPVLNYPSSLLVGVSGNKESNWFTLRTRKTYEDPDSNAVKKFLTSKKISPATLNIITSHREESFATRAQKKYGPRDLGS